MKKTLLVTFLFAGVLIAKGQFFIGLSPDLGNSNSKYLLTEQASAEYSWVDAKRIYTGGYYYGVKALNNQFEDKNVFHQINLMVGKHHYINDFMFTYQAGAGVLWGQIHDNKLLNDKSRSKPLNFTTLGVPLRVGAQYLLFETLIIGVDVTANLNARQIFFFPNITVGLGVF